MMDWAAIGLSILNVISFSSGWYLNTSVKAHRLKTRAELENYSALSRNAKVQLIENQPALLPPKNPSGEVQPGEVSTEIIVEEVETIRMTEEEHLKYLINLYPEAHSDFNEHRSNIKVSTRMDRYVMRLIVAFEDGKLQAKVKAHTLNFSNGDELWIANKYYGHYGNVYRSEHNPNLGTVHDSEYISLYTFMRVVDLEHRLSEPVMCLETVDGWK